MSRILKSSFINIDNNVVIDNSFINKDKNELENTNTSKLEQVNVESELSEEDNSLLQELKEEVLKNANEEAIKIIENAKEQALSEAQYIKEQALSEINETAEAKYNEAYEAGYNEGLKNAEMECEGIKNEANSILENTKAEREETILNMESEIINFIMDTTQNILTDAFKFNPEIISLIIKKTLLSIKEIKDIKIYVSEKQYDYVSENIFEITNVDVEKNNVEVLKDNSLLDDECLVETNIGTVKCGINEQFQTIKETLHYILK